MRVVYAGFVQAPDSPLSEDYIDIDSSIEHDERREDRRTALADARKRLAAHLPAGKQGSLSTLRLRNGWSQAQLAKAVGTSQAHIALIESGRKDVRASTVRKLARVLSVSPAELLDALPDVNQP